MTTFNAYALYDFDRCDSYLVWGTTWCHTKTKKCYLILNQDTDQQSYIEIENGLNSFGGIEKHIITISKVESPRMARGISTKKMLYKSPFENFNLAALPEPSKLEEGNCE